MSFFDKWNSLEICYVFGTSLSRNFIPFLPFLFFFFFEPGMMSLFGDKPNKDEKPKAKDVRRAKIGFFFLELTSHCEFGSET